MITSYLIILFSTALIEFLLALALLRQKKTFIFLLVNLIVHPVAFWMYQQWPFSLTTLVWIEVGVFIIEAGLVALLWGKKQRLEAAAVSILGNALTMIISFLI